MIALDFLLGSHNTIISTITAKPTENLMHLEIPEEKFQSSFYPHPDGQTVKASQTQRGCFPCNYCIIISEYTLCPDNKGFIKHLGYFNSFTY